MIKEKKGSLKDLQDIIRRVDFQRLTPTAGSLGVIKKLSGVRSATRSTLGNVMKW